MCSKGVLIALLKAGCTVVCTCISRNSSMCSRCVRTVEGTRIPGRCSRYVRTAVGTYLQQVAGSSIYARASTVGACSTYTNRCSTYVQNIGVGTYSTYSGAAPYFQYIGSAVRTNSSRCITCVGTAVGRCMTYL